MARKKSLDELDEEMEELERELRALEEGGSSEEVDLDSDEGPSSKGLMDRLPFGGGREAEEDDPPETDGGGDRLSGLMGRFKRSSGDAEASEAPAEPDRPEEGTPEADEVPEDPATDEGGGRLSGLMGRFKRSSGDDADEQETADDAADPADEDGGFLSRFKRSKEDAEEEPALEAPEPDEAPEEPAPPSEADAEGPEPVPEEPEPTPEPEPTSEPPADPEATPEPEPAAPEPRAATAWERTEEGGWRRPDGETLAAQGTDAPDEPEGPDEGRARSLLARFGRSSGDEPDDEPEPRAETDEAEEEDAEERRRPVLWVWLVAIVLGIALIGAAAAFFTGDGLTGGEAPTAAMTVDGGNPAPDGGFVALVGNTLTFDASATTGDVDEYRWTFGDGESTVTTEPTATHAYGAGGAYTVEVSAVGSESSTATVQVLVVTAPEASMEVLVGGSPVADPGTAGNNAFVGEPVTFDASGSAADEQTTLASYQWDVDGDGSPDAEGETAQFSFTEAGMWMVAVTVTDELGNEAQAQQMVHAGERFAFNETIGQAVPEAVENPHPISVAMGRMETRPAQVEAVLVYTAPETSVNEDLDLTLVDADGNTFTPDSDDNGAGEESISLTDLSSASLGDWTAQVSHEAPGLSEIQYELVVRVIY